MKIAVGLIAIFLSLIVLMQSCAVTTTAGLAENAIAGNAGAVGLLVGLCLFVGGAFSFGLPLIAGIVFAVSGLLAFIVSGQFGDMGVWSVVAFGLSGLSLLSWRSARKRRLAAGS